MRVKKMKSRTRVRFIVQKVLVGSVELLGALKRVLVCRLQFSIIFVTRERREEGSRSVARRSINVMVHADR